MLGVSMKLKYIFIILLFFTGISLYSENIYFYTKTNFAISQFWEGFSSNENGNKIIDRKFFSNFLTGSIGMGMEMVIWDMGVKRGSRLYFKTGIDMLFSGPTYIGYYNENTSNGSLYQANMHGSAFFMGMDMDFFFGGTFPKTDLLWGFGSIFNFMFPVYSPYTTSFNTKFYFYATPSILLGYDIAIPDTKFKITPQIRAGITCVPVMPSEIISETAGYEQGYGHVLTTGFYSGFYIDFSVAFSFWNVTWKK
jgi:hypothetical protein